MNKRLTISLAVCSITGAFMALFSSVIDGGIQSVFHFIWLAFFGALFGTVIGTPLCYAVLSNAWRAARPGRSMAALLAGSLLGGAASLAIIKMLPSALFDALPRAGILVIAAGPLLGGIAALALRPKPE